MNRSADLKIKVAGQIVRRLRRKGFSAYFVGGCVRDMLMKRKPKDIDIATSARISQIRKIFPKKTIAVGAQFGTLLVLEDKIAFQVSTFRDKFGRYASRISDDLKARDFTVNGLAYEPIEGEIIDLVDGRADIRRKRICAIGQAALSFSQDPLRLVRAVRFAANLRFSIEEETLEAVKKKAALIKKVSKERIRQELILILTGPNPYSGLMLLDQTSLLKYLLPQLDRLKGVSQPQVFHPEGDVFNHTLLMFKYLKNASLVLAFACLFHDIGKPKTYQLADRIRFSGHDRVGARMTDKILNQLRFSNKEREEIVACVQNHMRMLEAPKMRQSTLKRLFARPTFADELNLHHVDCLASHRDLRVFRFLNKKYREFKKAPVIPKPLLNGYELMKIGLTAGPIFGKILKAMVDLQLEGKLKDKTEAKKWVLKKFKTQSAKRKI